MKSEMEFIEAVWIQASREELHAYEIEVEAAMKQSRKMSALHLVSRCAILLTLFAIVIVGFILGKMQFSGILIYALGGALILAAWLIENKSYKEQRYRA